MLLDITQACGWLPVDAARFDYVVCAGYKWLLAPRGTAFLYAGAEARERLTPHLAGWYAADPPMRNLYGPPLRLAQTRRRFDISPAWMSWVGPGAGAGAARGLGIERVHAHDTALAARFARGLGLAGRRFRDRLARAARGGGRPARGGAGALRRPRRADALLVPRRQHRGGRGPGARRAGRLTQPSGNGCSSTPCAPGATPYS